MIIVTICPGGRAGSYLHASTEELRHPGHFGGLNLERWAWAHQGEQGAQGAQEAAPARSSLPLPLSGHCALDIRNR